MTTATANRQIRLRQRPDGRIDEHTFETVEEALPEPGPGQALVQNLYLSIDPTNRAWIGEEPTYLPPVGIGEVMRAVGLGRVLESNSEDYPEGALVTGLVGWQEYTLAGGEGIPLTVVPELELPIECMLGALGITGITAWFGHRGDRAAPGGRDDGRLGGRRSGRIRRRPAREAAGRARRRESRADPTSAPGWWTSSASTRPWTATTRGGGSSCERRARTASTSTSRTSAGRSWTRSSRC